MKPSSMFDDEQDIYKYHPKTKTELEEIIKKRIKEEGDDVDLNDIDISAINDLSYIFYGLNFNGDISGWDISNVTDMYGMFAGSSFNQDISKWQINKDCNKVFMFVNCPIDEKHNK